MTAKLSTNKVGALNLLFEMEKGIVSIVLSGLLYGYNLSWVEEEEYCGKPESFFLHFHSVIFWLKFK